MAEDHYATLEIRPNASQAEILRAYREAARRCHPDRHPGDEEATQKFYRVQAAFEVLGDPQQRAIYNRSRVSFDTTRISGFRPSGSGAAEEAYDSMTRRATVEVAEPALGLAVCTALGISLHYLAFFGNLGQAGHGSLPLSVLSGTPLGVLVEAVSCLLGITVLVGAVQMRHLENYRFAVAASIVATASCLSPWFLLGVPFGIWALVVLRNQRVSDAFWS
jgi:hypothetical protein